MSSIRMNIILVLCIVFMTAMQAAATEIKPVMQQLTLAGRRVKEKSLVNALLKRQFTGKNPPKCNRVFTKYQQKSIQEDLDWALPKAAVAAIVKSPCVKAVFAEIDHTESHDAIDEIEIEHEEVSFFKLINILSEQNQETLKQGVQTIISLRQYVKLQEIMHWPDYSVNAIALLAEHLWNGCQVGPEMTDIMFNLCCYPQLPTINKCVKQLKDIKNIRLWGAISVCRDAQVLTREERLVKECYVAIDDSISREGINPYLLVDRFWNHIHLYAKHSCWDNPFIRRGVSGQLVNKKTRRTRLHNLALFSVDCSEEVRVLASQGADIVAKCSMPSGRYSLAIPNIPTPLYLGNAHSKLCRRIHPGTDKTLHELVLALEGKAGEVCALDCSHRKLP